MEAKVLGLKWNISSDTFFFEINEIPEHVVTKRKMCSILPSLYDPLGFIGPMILPGKLLLQDAARLKLAWDDKVPHEIEHKWFKWLDGLRSLIDLQIPRCVQPRDFDDDTCIELRHSADASLQAYRACSYIRCINKFGQIHTQLLISKCRVAPIKQRTIPRLELQAALLAAELDKLLITELDIEIVGSYFWSDSEVVLSYIRNETTRFHVFVENRVSAIQQLSNPDDWQYVNTKDNPEDLLTTKTLQGTYGCLQLLKIYLLVVMVLYGPPGCALRPPSLFVPLAKSYYLKLLSCRNALYVSWYWSVSSSMRGGVIVDDKE